MDPRPRLLALLKKHGRSVASFQALEPGLSTWWDGADAEAAVVYFDTGRAWVAVADPLAAPEHVRDVAARFYAAARKENRRGSFFCCERSRRSAEKKCFSVSSPFGIPQNGRALLRRIDVSASKFVVRARSTSAFDAWV